MSSQPDSLRDWLSRTASAGYVAKGIIYFAIGWLALLTTIGLGGSESGTSEVIQKIATWPFGSVLLVLLGIGLVAYVLWRLAQAFFDTEEKGNDVKGWAARAGFAISGLIYTGLAWKCTTLVFNSFSSSQGSSNSERTQTLLGIPGGRWVLAAIGLAFIAVGVHQLYRAWTRAYRKNWHLDKRPNPPLPLLEGIARLGLAARGVTFVIIGILIGIAAWQLSPSRVQGLGGVLDMLAKQPFGDWILGFVAVGLIAYGGYCFINAGYRRVGNLN
ncbi:DUF1206 domain-containing protein [Salinicola aestuarinus]|uniref:DUF1206 domain-containing protein n=1 Tax=Salinicola aestuarinus TaxID=1949082 RepID=UPI000DA268B5|nr:DUF1206 domain-containing protein [Salinicola aestuarinus]